MLAILNKSHFSKSFIVFTLAFSRGPTAQSYVWSMIAAVKKLTLWKWPKLLTVPRSLLASKLLWFGFHLSVSSQVWTSLLFVAYT